MRFDAQDLFDLLPAVLRIRDRSHAMVTPGLLDADDRVALAGLDAKVSLTPAETEQRDLLRERSLGGPLANLLAVFAEQIAVLQEDLDQLYDDQFIETCADWVVPYIGELVGSHALHGIGRIASPRADVAHTIAYRRRKGTIGVIEQVARDVTGWNASAVEFFSRLIVTQYMNHLRPQCAASPDLRRWEPLERIGTAFDTVMHTVDVRRIASERGRYNIPNIGVILWRLQAYPLTGSPAAQLDAQRFRFHPLGIDQTLYTHPVTEDAIGDLATPINVPEPISRRVLDARPADYYTAAGDVPKSLCLYLYDTAAKATTAIDASHVQVCNLADSGTGWAHVPPAAGIYAVDPVLGRIAVASLPANTELRADFHHGFSADMGGGEYERAASYETSETPSQLWKVPTDFPTIQAAITALSGDGVVEIVDSGRYEEALSIDVTGKHIELRAANGHRPTIVLKGTMTLGGVKGAEISLNGLLIAGAGLEANAASGSKLRALSIAHCTLVPGFALAPDSAPKSPGAASLTADVPDLTVTITRSIVGTLATDSTMQVSAADSIIDATATSNVAYAALDGVSAGAPLSLNACTVIGKVHALTLPLISNSILLADRAASDPQWPAPVIADRRQEGCIRFTYLPLSARVPRRYQCLPESAQRPELAAPRFTSSRYGVPGYAQLARSAGKRLQSGADDEGQPGAFHSLYQPQREINLRVRLKEYLRVGLEAGIFYAS